MGERITWGTHRVAQPNTFDDWYASLATIDRTPHLFLTRSVPDALRDIEGDPSPMQAAQREQQIAQWMHGRESERWLARNNDKLLVDDDDD